MVATARVIRDVGLIVNAFQSAVSSVRRRFRSHPVAGVSGTNQVEWRARAIPPSYALIHNPDSSGVLYVGKLDSNVWLSSLLGCRARLRGELSLDELMFVGEGPLASQLQRRYVTLRCDDLRPATEAHRHQVCGRARLVVLGPDASPHHVDAVFQAICAGAVLVDADAHVGSGAVDTATVFSALKDAARSWGGPGSTMGEADGGVGQALNDLALIEQRVKVAQIIRALPQ